MDSLFLARSILSETGGSMASTDSEVAVYSRTSTSLFHRSRVTAREHSHAEQGSFAFSGLHSGCLHKQTFLRDECEEDDDEDDGVGAAGVHGGVVLPFAPFVHGDDVQTLGFSLGSSNLAWQHSLGDPGGHGEFLQHPL
ncbi:hypothetical protein BaOVIS_023220 [Babesia ovis]|uniref:Uncharacterized protein n=1 Tax=Babesia ovis TaxID=5869 RepID=A0A9W5TDQ9_BABOV|nr:hypothetical protein BaOVIS_023220 [Babesia ovis]